MLLLNSATVTTAQLFSSLSLLTFPGGAWREQGGAYVFYSNEERTDKKSRDQACLRWWLPRRSSPVMGWYAMTRSRFYSHRLDIDSVSAN